MKKIKTALISVSDKRNLKPILNSLKKNNIKIISSGGTYKEIKKLKFQCLEVSEFTESLLRQIKKYKFYLALLAFFNSQISVS